MTESTYDSCLLHCTEPFAMVGFQTDDTLILVSDYFAIKKNEIIKTVNFMIKQRENLAITNSIKFNGMRIELDENKTINMKHASYVESISLIKNHESSIINFRDVVREKLTSKNQYITHRTQNAYVASICQFETSFDFSYAAQAITVTSSDITSLNKRLKWQIENKTRGLKYVKLDKNSLRLIAFINAFFVDNRDFSFQIDYVICLIDESNRVNILH